MRPFLRFVNVTCACAGGAPGEFGQCRFISRRGRGRAGGGSVREGLRSIAPRSQFGFGNDDGGQRGALRYLSVALVRDALDADLLAADCVSGTGRALASRGARRVRSGRRGWAGKVVG